MLIVAKAFKMPCLGRGGARAYAATDVIDWPGGFYRRDISWRAARDPVELDRMTPGSAGF
jgi:hypothetical protein